MTDEEEMNDFHDDDREAGAGRFFWDTLFPDDPPAPQVPPVRTRLDGTGLHILARPPLNFAWDDIANYLGPADTGAPVWLFTFSGGLRLALEDGHLAVASEALPSNGSLMTGARYGWVLKVLGKTQNPPGLSDFEQGVRQLTYTLRCFAAITRMEGETNVVEMTRLGVALAERLRNFLKDTPAERLPAGERQRFRLLGETVRDLLTLVRENDAAVCASLLRSEPGTAADRPLADWARTACSLSLAAAGSVPYAQLRHLCALGIALPGGDGQPSGGVLEACAPAGITPLPDWGAADRADGRRLLLCTRAAPFPGTLLREDPEGTLIVLREDLLYYNRLAPPARRLVFPEGHPRTDTLYIREAQSPNAYLPAADLLSRRMRARYDELMRLLSALGAASAELTPVPAEASAVPVPETLAFLTAPRTFAPSAERPAVPRDLRLYAEEPDWQRLAKAVRSGPVRQATLSLGLPDRADILARAVFLCDRQFRRVLKNLPSAVTEGFFAEYRCLKARPWTYRISFLRGEAGPRAPAAGADGALTRTEVLFLSQAMHCVAGSGAADRSLRRRLGVLAGRAGIGAARAEQLIRRALELRGHAGADAERRD